MRRAREVVLFADTFNRYFERENLDDALSVLVAGGYRVYAPFPADPDERPLCCGRTFLSVGLVDEARREMQRTLDALAPYVARGMPVVGLEPSCLFTFRDELPALFKGEAVDALAANALLFEEFIAREHKQGHLNLPLGPLAEKGAAARPLPSEGVRRHGCGREHAPADPAAFRRDDRIQLLRHGRQLWLRRCDHRCLAQDGRAVLAARGAHGLQPMR